MRKVLSLSVLSIFLIFNFQNCGQGFHNDQSIGDGIFKSTSSQNSQTGGNAGSNLNGGNGTGYGGGGPVPDADSYFPLNYYLLNEGMVAGCMGGDCGIQLYTCSGGFDHPKFDTIEVMVNESEGRKNIQIFLWDGDKKYYAYMHWIDSYTEVDNFKWYPNTEFDYLEANDLSWGHIKAILDDEIIEVTMNCE